MTGIDLIAAKRQRQIEKEGWTAEHDKKHRSGQLAWAAICYAFPKHGEEVNILLTKLWPWDMKWWKPTPDNRIRELTKAGALIAAEIDRLLAKDGETSGC